MRSVFIRDGRFFRLEYIFKVYRSFRVVWWRRVGDLGLIRGVWDIFWYFVLVIGFGSRKSLRFSLMGGGFFCSVICYFLDGFREFGRRF